MNIFKADFAHSTHTCFILRIMESKERGSGYLLENSEIFSVRQLSDDHLQHSEATLLNSSAAAGEHRDIIPTRSFFISNKKKGSSELCGTSTVFLIPASWDATSCPASPLPTLPCIVSHVSQHNNTQERRNVLMCPGVEIPVGPAHRRVERVTS